MRIDKNVPLPPPSRGRNLSEFSKTLLAMNVGDSTFLKEPDKKAQKKLYNSVYKSAERQGFKVTVRFLDEGIRVWKR